MLNYSPLHAYTAVEKRLKRTSALLKNHAERARKNAAKRALYARIAADNRRRLRIERGYYLNLFTTKYWYICYELLVYLLRIIGIFTMNYWYIYYELLVYLLRIIGIFTTNYWYICYELLVYLL